MIDVILTSYKRWDLLTVTLDSLLSKCKSDFIENIYVYEDYGILNFTNDELEKYTELVNKYTDITFIAGNERVGQIKAIDILLSYVRSKYYLQLEDDWECLEWGFIKPSIDILQKEPMCNCVWLRGINTADINGHPLVFKDGLITFSTNYYWKGFSFGVSIKRLSDYELIKPYQKHTTFIPERCWESEHTIGEIYYCMGYFAATLEPKYFTHIGANQPIRK